jgi:hypothetical protein
MKHMTSSPTHLVVFSPDSALVNHLKTFSADLPFLSFEVGHGPQVTERAKLDALWATPMVGIELFGAAPPFPLHEARVVETPPVQIQSGLPRHGIVGVAVSANDPKAPDFNLRLVLSALLSAVKEFNARNSEQIVRVGVLPEDLELTRLDSSTAFKIIRDVYEKCA